MRFSPKTEKQIQEDRFPLIKPGKYHFEVTDGKEETSKKGNPMIVLRLKILSDGLDHLTYLNDYLMESIAHKLRHASYACGLADAYEHGELNAKAFIGKTGMVDIGIQKDKTGQYPDRNSVQDYVLEQSNVIGPCAPWDQEPPEWVR